MARKIFITGATGLIGRPFVAHIARVERSPTEIAPQVVVLARNANAVAQPGVRAVDGELAEPERWARELEGATDVVHLAALTGRASPAEFERVNVGATQDLVERCERAGVKRFLFVSSIAVRYPDVSAYPYARSKQRGEEIVRESKLDWAIVRPTIVLGRGGALLRSLEALAKLPVIPMFGGGRARVQPIHVADLAECLHAWVGDASFSRDTFDLGGPDVLAFRDLVARVRQRATREPARFVDLPGRASIRALAALEPLFRPVMPLTAGQIHAFVYDGVAQPNRLLERCAKGMKALEAMLDELVAHG